MKNDDQHIERTVTSWLELPFSDTSGQIYYPQKKKEPSTHPSYTLIRKKNHTLVRTSMEIIVHAHREIIPLATIIFGFFFIFRSEWFQCVYKPIEQMWKATNNIWRSLWKELKKYFNKILTYFVFELKTQNETISNYSTEFGNFKFQPDWNWFNGCTHCAALELLSEVSLIIHFTFRLPAFCGRNGQLVHIFNVFKYGSIFHHFGFF